MPEFHLRRMIAIVRNIAVSLALSVFLLGGPASAAILVFDVTVANAPAGKPSSFQLSFDIQGYAYGPPTLQASGRITAVGGAPVPFTPSPLSDISMAAGLADPSEVSGELTAELDNHRDFHFLLTMAVPLEATTDPDGTQRTRRWRTSLRLNLFEDGQAMPALMTWDKLIDILNDGHVLTFSEEGFHEVLRPNGTVAEADFKSFQGTAVFAGVLAVPEPSTWAMLILGFGMIGAMRRHRPRAAKGAFAG